MRLLRTAGRRRCRGRGGVFAAGLGPAASCERQQQAGCKGTAMTILAYGHRKRLVRGADLRRRESIGIGVAGPCMAQQTAFFRPAMDDPGWREYGR